MSTEKLTKQKIDKAAPRAARYFLWDTEVRGLGLRVAPSGRKVFQLFYRTEDGTQRSPVVGVYGAITLDQAREIARDMLGKVRAGGDPSASRKSARRAPTVEDACTKFLEEHAALKKPLTEAQYKQLIENRVKPALGTRKVASVTHEDVSRLVYGVGKEHPIAANRLRAMLSKLFNLTEKWGWRPTGSNPCAHIERNAEKKRHRDLSELELARLARVLIEAETPPAMTPKKGQTKNDNEDVSEDPRAIAAIRLLMFTGCRRNEVLRLKWSEVDLERGILRLGDSKTGAKVVHLNVASREVIEAQSAIAGNPFVFPGRFKGKPLHDVKRVWERVRARAKLDGEGAMRLHDLRHHFASTAAAQGLSLPLIGKLLGHRTPTTTARYAELADDPARRAAEEVGRALTGAMAKKEGEVGE